MENESDRVKVDLDRVNLQSQLFRHFRRQKTE